MNQVITIDPTTTRLSVAYVITELKNRGWQTLAERIFNAYETHYGSGTVGERLISGSALQQAIIAYKIKTGGHATLNLLGLYKEIIEGCQKRIPATWGW
jgi:hypothetical protein